MKISKIFIVAIALLLGFSACTPDNNGGNGGGTKIVWSESGNPIGEWKLTEWNNSKDLPFGVYLCLNEDNTFDIYQHTYTVLWVHYHGTYSLEGSVLTGTYSDGKSWHEYTIQYSEEPKLIRLTRTDTSGTSDVCVYAATEVPNEVKEDATEATNVRSVVVERFL